LVEYEITQGGCFWLGKRGGSSGYRLRAMGGDTLPLIIPIAVQVNAIGVQPPSDSIRSSRGAIGIHQWDKVEGNLWGDQTGRSGEIGKKFIYKSGRIGFIATMNAPD
jgi:hypothetical protein